jgi:hypothetical protein
MREFAFESGSFKALGAWSANAHQIAAFLTKASP